MKAFEQRSEISCADVTIGGLLVKTIVDFMNSPESNSENHQSFYSSASSRTSDSSMAGQIQNSDGVREGERE